MRLFKQCSLALLMILGLSLTGYSQTSGKKKMAKDKEPSHIGFGANLGNFRFYNNTFQFGLAPNIAYRVGESMAVGFMLKLDYYYIKFPQQDLKFSSFDLGPTVFARWKPLFKMDGATPFMQGLFLQAEYERAFIAREARDEFGNILLNSKGNRIEAVRTGEDYLYVGLGLSNGYPFSTFVSLHYNIIDQAQLSRIPFNYRFGFTYNY